MPQLVITVRGMEALRRKLGPALYERAMHDLLRDAALLGERVAREGAPRDTSALARSITHEVEPALARVYSTLGYAAVMELGRRPGARMPPLRALLPWMRRHGIPASAAFVLARAIAARGIRGRFFMRAARQAVERALPGLIARATRDVERRWEQ